MTPEARRIIDRIEALPTIPVVVARLVEIAHSPDACAAEVHAILQHDQSLALKVLRLANSSFYGSSGRIRTLSHAVVVLGFRTVRSIALSAFAFDALGWKGSRGFDRAAFWRHAVGVGVAARSLAERRGGPDPEEAFLAGVVHDVGKVALDQFAHAAFAGAIETARAKGLPIRDAERRTIGIDHAEVGGRLAERWGLPPTLAEAIALHHDPAAARLDPPLVSAVHVGDSLARACGIGRAGDDLVPPIEEAARAALGLSEEDIRAVLAVLPTVAAEADEVVRLTSGGR